MKHKTLSFRDQVFLACFLVTLVPLLLTSVVMVRLFTASLNRQSEQEANPADYGDPQPFCSASG